VISNYQKILQEFCIFNKSKKCFVSISWNVLFTKTLLC